jgi:transcription elongation factor Elf1
MIIIWGSRGRITEEVIIQVECIICQNQKLSICSIRKWFTFFFVPIFPISRKQYYFSCQSCENSYKIKDNVNLESLIKDIKMQEN